MLAGGEGVGEVLAVQVLRGGDEDGVDFLVLEHAAVIEVRFGSGGDGFDSLQGLGVDVGGGHAVDVGERDGLLEDLPSAVAGSDDGEADPFVRAHDVGRSQRAGETRGYVADEIAAGLHIDDLPGTQFLIIKHAIIGGTEGRP